MRLIITKKNRLRNGLSKIPAVKSARYVSSSIIISMIFLHEENSLSKTKVYNYEEIKSVMTIVTFILLFLSGERIKESNISTFTILFSTKCSCSNGDVVIHLGS